MALVKSYKPEIRLIIICNNETKCVREEVYLLYVKGNNTIILL